MFNRVKQIFHLKNFKSKKFIVSLIIFILIISILILVLLEYQGIIWHNSIFASSYQIKGLDVSHHQGEIDWQKVASLNKYRFVYIKATEGHDFIDDRFLINWQEAKKQNFYVGAYHFFSMRSSGEEQGKLFIQTVPKEEDNLPPVIDIEIDLNHDHKKVRREIKDFANLLEDHYKQKPILYVTKATYQVYIKGDFKNYDLWVRDILKPPFYAKNNWLIWQYSNRGRIDGINGYVDENFFKGDKKKFREIMLNEI